MATAIPSGLPNVVCGELWAGFQLDGHVERTYRRALFLESACFC